ncbi:MAG: PLP-dependent cysteine synthase family protein, partial [Succinivibrio sp.]
MQHTNITEIIGNTPLLRMHGLERHFNLKAQIFAKLEFFNPSGSVKDRIAYAMLKNALEKGEISQDTTIIEPTSGNTGISLAAVCAALGLKLIIVMPDTMTKERRTMLRGYGAKVVLTQGALGMKGSIEKA